MLPQSQPTLAVTYKCTQGHHTIRWWQIPITIPSDVLCGVCHGVAVVKREEKARHEGLRSELKRYLLP